MGFILPLGLLGLGLGALGVAALAGYGLRRLAMAERRLPCDFCQTQEYPEALTYDPATATFACLNYICLQDQDRERYTRLGDDMGFA